MKIDNIQIKNFKFHHFLQFNIKKQNCLIYGENGTGKSSIYYALYSVLYALKDKRFINNMINIDELYKNLYYPSEDIEVLLKFNNGGIIKRVNENIENIEILEKDKHLGERIFSNIGIPTIYFTNEKILSKIAIEDLFNYIKNELIIHFSKLYKIIDSHNDIKTDLKRGVDIDEFLIKRRINKDNLCKHYIQNIIPWNEINSIITNDFQENFEIEYEFIESQINGDKQFIEPKINIKIKSIDKSIDKFSNESQIKLIGIAFFFALTKKYETKTELKFLVLDDFLTSLDMSNRKLIIQYILNNFQYYQKIILTHNIQFNNLIIKLLKNKDELEKWDIKTIYTKTFSNSNEAVVVDTNRDYIQIAKKALDNYELEKCGNNLRKEFEYIMTTFEQILQIGRVEELNNILQYFKDKDEVILNINEVVKLANNIKGTLSNNSVDFDKKLDIISKQIEDIKSKEIKYLKHLLYETEFYKDIILNVTSHDDREKEKYKKEFKQVIKLLEKLSLQLDGIK